MALKGRANQTKANENLVADGQLQFINMLRDGTVITADWMQQAIIQGRGHMVTVGSLTTPITGGNSTVVDLDVPQLVIGVPSGTSILPFSIRVCGSAIPPTADSDEYDILIAVDQDKMNASSSGTSVSETIYNLNTLNTDQVSTCYANSDYTVTMVDPVLDLELAHATKVYEEFSSTGILLIDIELNYEPRICPIINGPAMLIVYWGGTSVALNAFCTAQWLEYPSTRFT
jgi:hypothetical protein